MHTFRWIPLTLNSLLVTVFWRREVSGALNDTRELSDVIEERGTQIPPQHRSVYEMPEIEKKTAHDPLRVIAARGEMDAALRRSIA